MHWSGPSWDALKMGTSALSLTSHLLSREIVTRLWFQLGTAWERICTLTEKKKKLLKQCLLNNKLLNKTFNYLIKLLPLKYLFASCCWAASGGLISNAGESKPRALQAKVSLRGDDPQHPDMAAVPPAHRPLSAAALPVLLQAFSSLLFPHSASSCKAPVTHPRGGAPWQLVLAAEVPGLPWGSR